ncbi:cytochrome c [Vibrio sp.]|uniref:Cytochrome c n=1 Tax=Vibrio viridaestus TaxID=2487322 RepID=A0A3N9TKE3_9VIBR|nr:cytochrome c [Vibrio viridaestus]MDC0609856.1 cytochrome c [Vibrio sp.]RQW64730.1 cytochrome c [Vibrio viridaestus]
MANKKRGIVKILLAVVVVVIVVAGVRLWQTLDTSRSDAADDTVKLSDYKANDPEAVKRGEYVMRVGDCSACHTAGHGTMGGGYEIKTPFGSLYSSNITPDAETGIGNMTERDFFNAVRQGIGSHGLLYPAMPYTAYVKMTDEDMHDLWAYFSTVKPVKNDIEETKDMPFPFNIRLAMSGWNLLFFKNEGIEPDTTQTEEWNRGQYLVDGGGHCSACHGPRNFLGAEIQSEYMEGGNLGEWYAPGLTSNPHIGIGGMSEQQIMDYLKTGSDGIAVATGPMAEAVEHSTQYFTDSDLKAIAVYLKSIPAAKGGEKHPKLDVPESAALDYEVNCSACHGLKGEGIKGMVPAFANNRVIVADDPTNLIHAMLKGARAAHTETAQTAAGMPSFAWKMNDQEVANVLNYVRNTWGNTAKEITASQVAEMRDSLGAREKIQAGK